KASNARATARCRGARAAGWSGRSRNLRSSTRGISDRLDLVEKRLGIGIEDALALVAAEINGFALVDELRLGGGRWSLHHANRIQGHGWPPLSRWTGCWAARAVPGQTRYRIAEFSQIGRFDGR